MVEHKLPFGIKAEYKFPEWYVEINNIKYYIGNNDKIKHFAYHIRRIQELYRLNRFNPLSSIKDLKQTVILNSGFGLVDTGDYTTKQLEEKMLSLEAASEKCCWGNILNGDTLKMDDEPGEFKYVPNSTKGFETKVLVQPDGCNYDESFFVYVDSNVKPYKMLDIFFIYSFYQGSLKLQEIYKNNWIY